MAGFPDTDDLVYPLTLEREPRKYRSTQQIAAVPNELITVPQMGCPAARSRSSESTERNERNMIRNSTIHRGGFIGFAQEGLIPFPMLLSVIFSSREAASVILTCG
jgi:hypothetical protein